MCVAASAILLGYTSARALRVPLTYDEAASYLLYLSTDVLSIFDFGVATNHFLNTVLARVATAVGGHGELALRLPALLGHLLYVTFTVRLMRRFTVGAIGLGGFLLLNVNPYMLDFFALSRGYGLSLGLLQGAIYYLLRAIDGPPPGDDRGYRAALWLAAGAALANFAAITAYVALGAVAMASALAHAWQGRRAPELSPASHPALGTSRWLLWGLPVACAFNFLVVSQDVNLSERLYLPVSVRIVGLDAITMADVAVQRIDRRQRTQPLPFRDAMWRSERPAHFHGVRIDLPSDALGTLQAVEIIVGARVLSFDRAAIDSMRAAMPDGRSVVDVGEALATVRSRVPAFRRVINWRGDAVLAVLATGRTLLVVSILGVVALLLHLVRRFLTSRRWLGASRWQALTSSALALAALAGYPLYLLRRNRELFFGGTRDIVHDTFFSIIDASLYGRVYHPDQTRLIAGAIGATVLIYLALVCWPRWRASASRVVHAGAVLAIMALCALAAVAQRALFDTPLPLGRTAIFYIPLYGVFLTLLLQCLRDAGPLARWLPLPALGVVVGLALAHLAATANLTRTFDWPLDADTRSMVNDLDRVIASEGSRDRPVSLGIDWFYYPVVRYYLERHDMTAVEVDVLPSLAAHDFLFVRRGPGTDAQAIAIYPQSGSMLARPH